MFFASGTNHGGDGHEAVVQDGAQATQDAAHAVAEHGAEHAAEHASSVDPMSHVVNHDYWELTHSIKVNFHDWLAAKLPFLEHNPLGIDFTPTMHVLMLWLAGLALFLVLRSIANKEQGMVPKGRLRNFFESIVVFLRDEVVYNIMGDKVGRRFLPYLLTVFFFILFTNLLGLIPSMATATGNINVTATLAIFTFLMTQLSGMRENGFLGHWKGLVPPGVPFFLIPIMIPIEIMGMFTKPFALTVRLFANMIAGHIIILSFFNLIFAMGKMPYLAVLPFAGAVAISAFEIFVAFLQAFIFTFLSTIFIYQAVHPDH